MLVVIMLHAVMMRVVVIMMVIVIMVVMMIMIVAVAVQEIRLDIEDAIEIEGLAVEHFAQAQSVSAGCDAASHKD